MDCVRVSEREIEGEVWDANYKEMGTDSKLSREACRQTCVSDLDCVAWKYNFGGGNCSLADTIKGAYPHLKREKDVVSGLIACENTYSMLKTMGLVFLVVLVLVGLWFLLRCKAKT